MTFVFEAAFLLAFVFTGTSASDKKNVKGGDLQLCSSSGMAMTGFTRDGYCTDLDDDQGSHHICITMWPDGVGEGTNFCSQTGQSDWCEEEMPCYEDENKMCHIKNWCVCQWAWEMYVEKNGCDNIVDLHCDSVNAKALEAYESDPTTHATALACLKEKCDLDAMRGRANATVSAYNAQHASRLNALAAAQ